MTSENQPTYARLPEDVLQDLLASSGDLATEVNEMLGVAISQQGVLRQGLENLGILRTFTPKDPVSISGIDGGFAVERTAAVDVGLVIAVGVEGLSNTTTSWDTTQHSYWKKVLSHDVENERLARGLMIAHELAILVDAPHEFRILDGSHLTLVIQLNSALTVQNAELRAEAKTEWARLNTIKALKEASTATNIVAMPKFDSSRDITQKVEVQTGVMLPGCDDKFLMGLLLQAGEYTAPQKVPLQPWSSLHFNPVTAEDQEIADQFKLAITHLVERRINYIFFKPDEFSPAFRIETKDSLNNADLEILCSTLNAQMTGPFVKEPYPQYLADVMAKSVGVGLSAMISAIQLNLSRSGTPELAEVLIRSYRTEGV